MDESRQLSTLYRKKKYIFEESDEPPSLPSQQLERQIQWSVSRNHTPTSYVHAFDPSPQMSPASKLDGTCYDLCYILEKRPSSTHFPISSFASFFLMLPGRLGHNLALDDSIACLCSMYADSLRRAQSPLKSSLQLYSRSLNSLRSSLRVPSTRTESETICASIIMQVCEVRAQSWNS